MGGKQLGGILEDKRAKMGDNKKSTTETSIAKEKIIVYLSCFCFFPIDIVLMRPGGGWSAAKPKKGGCVPLSALLLAQGSLVARPNALPIGLARPEERGRIHLVKTIPRPPTGASTPTVLRHQKRLN